MKQKIIFLIILLAHFGKAQINFTHNWSWGFGTGDLNAMNSSTVDANGNLYVTGQLDGVMDFDPGAGVTSYTGSGKCFFAKYDASGALVWAKMLDGGGLSNGLAIGVDVSGDVYISGKFYSGDVDFDPSPGTFTMMPSQNDMFIARYNSGGAFAWAKQIGGGGNVEVYSMKVSGTDLIFTGSFDNSPDFDGGLGNVPLSSAGSTDAFVTKYATTGIFSWAFRIGDVGPDIGRGIDVDPSGNIYVSGDFQLAADFNPGAPTVTLTNNGLEDIFLAKYNSSGNFVWADAMGGNGQEYGLKVKYTAGGELILSGAVESATLDADPTGVVSIINKISGAGAMDTYLAKYNSTNGNLVWAKNAGSTGLENVVVYDMITDAQSNIYITGSFGGVVDFDLNGGVNSFTAVNVPYSDIFIAKYDNLSNLIYVKHVGGGSNSGDKATSINLYNYNVFIVGEYTNIIDMDPEPATSNINPTAGRDIFIAKYTECNFPQLGGISSPGTVCSGATISLSVLSGSLNQATSWQWYTGSCGGTALGTGTTVTTTAVANNTFYVRGEGGCVPGGITCLTMTVTVSSSKNISGLVTTATVTPVAGYVTLYRSEIGFQKYDSLTTENIDALGNFTFTNRPAGNYILKATPTLTNLQTTYANSAISWKGAAILNHGCVTNTIQNINVIPLTNLGTGPGVLSGKIVEGLKYGFKGGAVVPGGPIKGAQVKCGRNPGGDAVGQSITNASGEYTLSNLPLNAAGQSYFVLVDIPGLDTNGTYHKVITVGTSTFSNLDFVADSAKINPGAYVGIKKITTAKAELKVYPNPTHGIINIEVELLYETEIDIKVINILGKEMFSCSPKIMNKKIQLDLTDLTDGIYFMKFKIGEEERTTKIILTR